MQTFADQSVIAIENVRLFNETREALEQQTATAEVLQVISGSMADPKPVFDKILDSCKHLFGSDDTAVLLVDEQDQVHLGAYVGKARDAVAATFPAPLAKSPAGRAIRERRVAHYPDVANDPGVTRAVRNVAKLAGYKAMAYAPMLWNERGIGAIGVSRAVGGFSAKELALLQTFADQAVIAIQNARLFNETKEALERQTATGEILASISGSMTDTQPVFDAIARNLLRLFGDRVRNRCAGTRRKGGTRRNPGGTRLREAGGELSTSARRINPSWARRFSQERFRNSYRSSAIRQRRPRTEQFARDFGFNAQIAAPMVREGKVIGADRHCASRCRAVRRQAGRSHHVLRRPGCDRGRERAPVQRDQEALERQTATAEVLQVISGSVADAKPVFEKILDSCKRLIPSDGGAVLVVDEQQQVEVGAVHGDADGMFTRGYPRPIERTVLGLAFDSRRPLYYPEAITAEGVPDVVRRFAKKSGFASMLVAPMIWEGRRIGCISIARQAAFAFSEKDIDLLQSFADQGVIAIQNARLFKETNEALKRQTASAEILSVISSSVADAAPVFEKILESCRKLFAGSANGILLIDEHGRARIAAHDGPERERVTELVAAGFADGLVQVEALRNRQPLHYVDALAEEARGPVGRIATAAWHRVLLAGRGADDVAGPPGRLAVCDAPARHRLQRDRDRADEDLRRPGGDRDPERAAVQRDAGVARAADGHLRRAAGDQRIAHRRAAGVRDHCRARGGVDGRALLPGDAARRRSVAPGQPARRQRGRHVRAARCLAAAPARQHLDRGARDTPARRGQRGRPAGAARRRVRAGDEARLRTGGFPQRPVPCRCCATSRSSARSPSTAPRPACTPTRKWRCCRPSPARPWSRSRTCACSTRPRRRWSGRPPRPRCCSVISSSVADTRAGVRQDPRQLPAPVRRATQMGMLLAGDDGQVHAAAWRGAALEQPSHAPSRNRSNRRITARAIARAAARCTYPTSAAMPSRYRPGDPRRGGADRQLSRRRVAPMLLGGRGHRLDRACMRQPPQAVQRRRNWRCCKTFADQAVIAIQNARLFNETKEALEQQTATAEVLQVISNSVADTRRCSTRSSTAASACSS